MFNKNQLLTIVILVNIIVNCIGFSIKLPHLGCVDDDEFGCYGKKCWSRCYLTSFVVPFAQPWIYEWCYTTRRPSGLSASHAHCTTKSDCTPCMNCAGFCSPGKVHEIKTMPNETAYT